MVSSALLSAVVAVQALAAPVGATAPRVGLGVVPFILLGLLFRNLTARQDVLVKKVIERVTKLGEVSRPFVAGLFAESCSAAASVSRGRRLSRSSAMSRSGA